MDIGKTLIFITVASDINCKRLKIPPLQLGDLRVLYFLKRFPNRTPKSINEVLSNVNRSKSVSTLSGRLEVLYRFGLVSKDEGKRYSLSINGREFLSDIKNYLYNKRWSRNDTSVFKTRTVK